MKILFCSDGTPSSDEAARLTSLLIGQCHAEITLLGIVEQPRDEQPLRSALESEAQLLRGRESKIEITLRAGEPISQIVELTDANKFDLTIIGTRGQGPSGLYLRSAKTYEAVKAVHSPVLVVIGKCPQLKRILVCTGGKQFISDAVMLTGQLAACAGASVTLLHVMAEPPAMYADLVRLEEDVDRLISSGSELGENLRTDKEALEKLGVTTEIRVRHGLVLDQVFEEVRDGNYDLIVTGSSQTRGPLRHYIMGDLTHSILNRASCPVLVARSGKPRPARNLWRALKGLFAPRRE